MSNPHISFVVLYYDNPDMLAEQLKCWNGYAEVFREPPEIILVDDGSPRTQAADIVRAKGCDIPIKVLRIREDIPWNFAGARNLGCFQAQDWIYVSDIDTLLLPVDAQKMFEAIPLLPHRYYMPKRVFLPDLVPATDGVVNLLFHKSKFLEIGGYDEDYAGHYGREEIDFVIRLRKSAGLLYRGDVLIRVVPHQLLHDASTHGRVRDKSRNVALFDQKCAAAFPTPVNPLRFTWERVL